MNTVLFADFFKCTGVAWYLALMIYIVPGLINALKRNLFYTQSKRYNLKPKSFVQHSL